MSNIQSVYVSSEPTEIVVILHNICINPLQYNVGKHMNEQEIFWSEEFGAEYIGRNSMDRLLSANISFFSKILSRTGKVGSVLELGCNIGINLKALQFLDGSIELSGIEINDQAVAVAKTNLPAASIKQGSIIESIDNRVDLTFTKTVLIHIHPDSLQTAYKNLYENSAQYILIAEYYNPVPTSVVYRGHKNKLFKRDFCGEILDSFSDLRLIDYGFLYNRDNIFPQDDINWFLLEKS